MPTDFIHDFWSPAGTTNMRRQLNYKTNLMKVIRNKLQKSTLIFTPVLLLITLVYNTIKSTKPEIYPSKFGSTLHPFNHITITLKVVPK